MAGRAGPPSPRPPLAGEDASRVEGGRRRAYQFPNVLIQNRRRTCPAERASPVVRAARRTPACAPPFRRRALRVQAPLRTGTLAPTAASWSAPRAFGAVGAIPYAPWLTRQYNGNMIRLTLAAMTMLAAACAQTSLQIPENLKVPATETVLLTALGEGKQVYACRSRPGGVPPGPGLEWYLDRPEARLLDESGKQIGKHYKGPTWEAADGSKVTGQVLQRANARKADAVPWLLLKATSHDGDGTLARVSYIQRVDTEGGVAPAEGCDQTHAGSESGVPYTARYLFYVGRQ